MGREGESLVLREVATSSPEPDDANAADPHDPTPTDLYVFDTNTSERPSDGYLQVVGALDRDDPRRSR